MGWYWCDCVQGENKTYLLYNIIIQTLGLQRKAGGIGRLAWSACVWIQLHLPIMWKTASTLIPIKLRKGHLHMALKNTDIHEHYFNLKTIITTDALDQSSFLFAVDDHHHQLSDDFHRRVLAVSSGPKRLVFFLPSFELFIPRLRHTHIKPTTAKVNGRRMSTPSSQSTR